MAIAEMMQFVDNRFIIQRDKYELTGNLEEGLRMDLHWILKKACILISGLPLTGRTE